MRAGLIGLAIGLALADSSIVTLALPDVLREFDVDESASASPIARPIRPARMRRV